MDGAKVGHDESEFAASSTERWDRSNRADLIESTTACHDAQVPGLGLYFASNHVHLTVLVAKSDDYTAGFQR